MTSAHEQSKAHQVRAMFDRIAERYDLINALMTFGMHGRWRRLAARAAQPRGGLVLDIGAGTCDLALALADGGARQVVAADFSLSMLQRAQGKLDHRPAAATAIERIAGDALTLPFADAVFDCAANGFVLRNVADLSVTFAEIFRVLRPGGRLVCLDITHPPRLVAPVFRPYFERLVPLMGGLISGDREAYRYLPSSVRSFPTLDRLDDMLRNTGFEQVRHRRLGFGVVGLHRAVKPVDRS